MRLPELAAEQDRRGAAHQRAEVLRGRPDGECGDHGDECGQHRQPKDGVVEWQRPESFQRDFVGEDPAEHLPQLAHKDRGVGGCEPEAEDERQKRATDPEREPADAALPIEAAPEGQQEDRIVDRAGRQADEGPRDERPAVSRDRPHDQGPGQRVVHAAGHDRRVGEQQVEHGRGDSEADGAKMPPADDDHSRHDRQLRQDRHHAGGGLVDDAAVDLTVLARIGCIRIG